MVQDAFNLKRDDAAPLIPDAQGRLPIPGSVDRFSSFSSAANSSQQGKLSNRKLGVNIVGKLKGVEGVSSICKDEDLRPPLASGSGGKILQVAPSNNTFSLAHKVSGKSPERIPGNCLKQSAPSSSTALVDGSQSNPAAFNFAKMVIEPSHETSEQLENNVAPAADSMQQLPIMDVAFGYEPSVADPVTRKSYAAAVKFCGEAAHHNSGLVFSNTNLGGPNIFFQ